MCHTARQSSEPWHDLPLLNSSPLAYGLWYDEKSLLVMMLFIIVNNNNNNNSLLSCHFETVSQDSV